MRELRKEGRGVKGTHTLALIEKPLPASDLLLRGFGHSTLICRRGEAMDEIGTMTNNYTLVFVNCLGFMARTIFESLLSELCAPPLLPRKYGLYIF